LKEARIIQALAGNVKRMYQSALILNFAAAFCRKNPLRESNVNGRFYSSAA